MSEAPQIRLAAARTSCWIGALAIVLFLTSPASAASMVPLSGRILGLVTDAAGIPQMGAAVLLLNREEKLSQRILTDEKGAFSFDGLAAGIYSIHVSLASFMPVSRANIFVQPGIRSLLNVSLAGLFSSIQVVTPSVEQRAIMNDDWKWVLRTSNATRPVLRLLPGWKPDDSSGAERRASTGIFSDTRAMVQVSAGDGGRVTSFGNETDLGTAFSLATSVMGRNQIQFSGNVGFAALSGAPSAGFQAGFSRGGGEEAIPEVTVAMRQMYLPGRVTAALGPSSEPVLRTLSLTAREATQLSDSVRLEYGFALDTITFAQRMNFFSPYSRLIYSISKDEQLEFSYTSGIPRSDMFLGVNSMGSGDLQNGINALALYPRISVRDSRAKVQQSQSFEAGYHRALGSRTFSAAVFREGVSNAALTISGTDSLYPAWDILPDLFSSSSIFNAGSYESLGYMVSLNQKIGESWKVGLMVSSGGALVTNRTEITGDSPDDLRAMIRQGRRNALTPQISGTLPITGTQIGASYQFTDRRSVTPAHFYATQMARAEAGLNIQLRQPIPTSSLLPIHMEATADLRNLLADGYLPFNLSDGRQVVLMHTPRSFRGGLSFIF